MLLFFGYCMSVAWSICYIIYGKSSINDWAKGEIPDTSSQHIMSRKNAYAYQEGLEQQYSIW